MLFKFKKDVTNFVSIIMILYKNVHDFLTKLESRIFYINFSTLFKYVLHLCIILTDSLIKILLFFYKLSVSI